MSEMVEKVARALALSHGGAMVGRGQSIASREMGWTPDGEYMQRYVERHWKEYIHAARFAIEAMRKPTQAMITAANDVEFWDGPDRGEGSPPVGDAWEAMIDEALK